MVGQRQPEFILYIPVPVSQVWSKATDPDVFSRYFDLLEETIKENGLNGRLPLDLKSPKLVFEKVCHASCVTTGDKTQITVVACVSATGFSIP